MKLTNIELEQIGALFINKEQLLKNYNPFEMGTTTPTFVTKENGGFQLTICKSLEEFKEVRSYMEQYNEILVVCPMTIETYLPMFLKGQLTLKELVTNLTK